MSMKVTGTLLLIGVLIASAVSYQLGHFTKDTSLSNNIWHLPEPHAVLASRDSPSVHADCECGRKKSSRIVGGEVAASGEFPFAAKLAFFGTFICGGTLISDRFVLTAAHCTRQKTADTLKVLLGVNTEKEPGGLWLQVLQKIEHPDHDPATHNMDMSLLRIDPVNFADNDAIRPACWPIADKDYTDTTVTTIGWGKTAEQGNISDDLRTVDVPIVPNSSCQKMYTGSNITENMICAGVSGKDSCQGDSGGALLFKNIGGYYDIIGVTSFGLGCARPNYPGVYARVSGALAWIKDGTKGSRSCMRPN